MRLLEILANATDKAASKARAASAGSSQTVALPSPDGAKSTGTLTQYADDANTFDVGGESGSMTEVNTHDSKATVKLAFHTRVRVDKCPARDGTVAGHWEFRVSAKTDLKALAGDASLVGNVQLIGEATAYVGDDARLKYYDLTIRTFVSHDVHGSDAAEGDFGSVATATDTLTFTHLDPHTVAFKASQVKESGAIKGDWSAKGLANLATLIGDGAVLAIIQLNDAYVQKSEHNFYDEAACLKIKVDPPGSVAGQGQTIKLAALLMPTTGGPVNQKLTATADGATVVPVSDQATSTDPAHFTMTTGSDNVASVTFEGKSKRGRSLDTEYWNVLGKVVLTASQVQNETTTIPGTTERDTYQRNLTFTATIPLTTVIPVGNAGAFTATGAAPFTLAPGVETDTTTHSSSEGTITETLQSWTPGTIQVTVDATVTNTGPTYTVTYMTPRLPNGDTDLPVGTYTDNFGNIETARIPVGLWPWVAGEPTVFSGQFRAVSPDVIQRTDTTTINEPDDTETDTTQTQIVG